MVLVRFVRNSFYVVLVKGHGPGKKGMTLREKGHGTAPCLNWLGGTTDVTSYDKVNYSIISSDFNAYISNVNNIGIFLQYFFSSD